MKKILVPYANFAANMTTPVTVRKRIITTAVALAVACQIKITYQEVENPDEYFVQNHSAAVLRIVSCFNEATLLDIKYAEQVCRMFWLQRYDTIFECPAFTGAKDIFLEMFSVDKYFSESEQQAINDNRSDIAQLYNIVCPAVKELLQDN